MDPWDLLDPVDIVKKLPKDLDEQLSSKKWQERKEALEAVNGILNENPKLADNPDYAGLIESFTKILGSDANINCAALAAKNLTAFARGLRNKFGPYVASVASVVFEKFKEKRVQLKDPLIELIDAIFASSSLNGLSQTILESAGKAKINPSQKTQLDQFLYRVFRTLAPKAIPKGLIKDLVAFLSDHAFDSDPEVRDSSLAALGAMQKCIGEKAFSIFLPANISNDATKIAKLTEYTNKAEQEATTLIAVQSLSTNTTSSQVQSTQAGQIATNDLKENPGNEPQIDSWDLLTPVNVMPKFPSNLDEQLSSKKWQERKEALEAVNGILNENPKLADNPDYAGLIETFTKILGSDANINCAALAAKNLTAFARGLRNKFGLHAASVASVVFEKFKEKRAQLKDPLIELIDAIFASSNLAALSQIILETAGKAKTNPSQKSQLDQFLCRIFRTVSPKDIPKGLIKDLVIFLSDHAFDSDPEVRDSSLSALGTMKTCIGEKTFSVFLPANISNDATKMAKLNEYKAKVEEVIPTLSAPTLSVAQSSTTNANTTQSHISSKADSVVSNDQKDLQILQKEPKIEIEQLDKPVDIAKKLPKDLDTQLNSKNWQDRKAALEAVNGILNENPKLADNPDYYNELIETFTRILGSDANINCAALAAKNLTAFARGLRNKFGPHAASVASVVFEKFKEKRAQLKDPLIELIDAIFACSTLNVLSKIIVEALGKSKTNPSQKSLIDQFLYRVFLTVAPKDIPKGLIKDLVAFLSEHAFDSDSEVKNSALAALGAMQKCIGEKAFSVFLPANISKDASKMAKLTEFKNKAEQESPNRPSHQILSTPQSSNQPARARSASGTRRTLASSMLANQSMASTGADDSTIRLPRRSHAGTGMSSAKSHSSALNTTFSTTTGGLFQLDPKFFDNDFDEPTLTMNNTAISLGRKSALNSTFTKAGPAERGVLSSRNGGGGPSSSIVIEQQDLQPIKPVVRPTSTFSRRSESVSSISSLESAEHIDRAVHNVSSLQLNIAEEAIAQLLHLLNDPSNRQYLSDRIELTLREIVTQIFHIRGQHLEQLEAAKESEAIGGEPSPRAAAKEAELEEFMRSICNFLTTLTKDSKMMQKISADALRVFIDAILCLINDNRLKNLNTQIFRSLNIVCIRLCELPNPNSCFVALMKLVSKYQGQHPESKMNDLLRKCMIKHTDVLANSTLVEQIDPPTVLEPIHQFYARFYVLNEKQEVDDKVKETVKVLSVYIQRLVLNKRYSILNHLYQFPESSHIVNYVRRCVRAIGKRTPTTNESKMTTTGTMDASQMGGQIGMPEELEKLFERISEDFFGGAVEELYNLMDIHPEQNGNFEALMAKCEYACIVPKVFNEIRQCRLRKEQVQPGICVSRVLPEETRMFLEQLKQIEDRMDDISAKYQLNGISSPPQQTNQQQKGRGGNISQKSTP